MPHKKTAFKGSFLTVMQQKKELPNGRVAGIEWVEHPGAVLIIPFLTEDRVVLLRQYRAVLESWIYELPAGTLEEGEEPLACARREVIEETGYAARRMTPMGHIYPVPGYSTEKLVLFKAEDLVEQHADKDADEVIETLTVTRSGFREMVAQGTIVDAKTICAMGMCGWL